MPSEKLLDNPIVVELDPQEKPPSLGMDFQTFFLGGIFIFLLLTVMRTASEIFMPVVLAFILKLVLQPVLRYLEKLRIPRRIAAFFILCVLVFSVMALGDTLSGPASSWADKVTVGLPQLQEKFNTLSRPMKKTQKILGQAEDMTKGAGPKIMPVAVQGTRFSDRVLDGTQALAAGLFTTMVVLFFLLASGDTFLRKLVEVLPRFKDKRQAVDISQKIEHDISAYLLTITMMNAAVGIATVLVMAICHVQDPLLWGTLAFLLNYLPVVGPISGVVIFALVGTLADIDGAALLPATLYLLIHIAESSVITPMLLAKRFTLNPVLVILSLVFWYWMWGFAGAILAVPMLAIIKIICDRIERLQAFGHFLES